MSKSVVFLIVGILIFLFSSFMLFRGSATQAMIASFGISIGFVMTGFAAYGIKYGKKQ